MNKNDNDLRELMKGVYNNSQEYITFDRFNKDLFFVRHTAREVEYNINGFIEKNKDEIS